MSIRKHIPNALTCCNLMCGCMAVGTLVASLAQGQPAYGAALGFIIAGAVFDFFDGFVARLLGVSSPIGKELDSLADCITFGFAPAAVVFALLTEPGVSAGAPAVPALPVSAAGALPFVALLIAAFSALRLAKFNLDERQTTSFIGLPTPANALFWAALAYGAHDWLCGVPGARWMVAAGALLSCGLLVAEVPMFALKFKSYGWADNRLRYSFMLFALLVLLGMGWTGLAVVIVAYVLLSVVSGKACR